MYSPYQDFLNKEAAIAGGLPPSSLAWNDLENMMSLWVFWNLYIDYYLLL